MALTGPAFGRTLYLARLMEADMTWQLREATDRFSEVFDRALSEGPQEVTRDGDEQVIVLSKRDYARLEGKKSSFKEFLFSIPSLEGVDLKRDQSPGREIGF